MTGVALTIRSPSRASTTFSTPCVRRGAEPGSLHVAHLALPEIGPLPDVRDRVHHAIVFRDPGLHAYSLLAPDRVELVHDLEPLGVGRPVHAAHVDDVVVVQPGIAV